MRVGILTSVERRHCYFAEAIGAQANVVAVGYEEIGYSPADTDAFELTPEESRIVARHFDDRTQEERRAFGDAGMLEDTSTCRVQRIAPGKLNTAKTLALLEAAGTDTVLIFGTNLIRAPLLGRWPGRMINMHLGLSPYYRGTATNFYPLLNDEPQYVGATIHLIDSRIDRGAILGHARPEIVAEDRPHSIGCKAIVAGIEKLLTILADIETGDVTPVPQWPVKDARLYLRKDYHPRQVVELSKMLAEGSITRYVARADAVRNTMRLIE